MKKIYTLLAGVLFYTYFINAQGWNYQYPIPSSQNPLNIYQNTDSSYIVLCEEGSLIAGWDIRIMHIDKYGQLLNSRLYELGNVRPKKMVRDFDGDYMIVSNNLTTDEAILIKTNSQGDSLWSRIIDFSDILDAKSITRAYDNTFVCIAQSNADKYLIKLNPSGDTLWTKNVGYIYNYKNLIETANHNLIVYGTYSSFNDAIIRYDEFGNIIYWNDLDWQWGSANFIESKDFGLMFGGYDTETGGPLLLKTNGISEPIWNILFDTNCDRIYDIDTSYFDFYYAVGADFSDISDSSDIVIIKFTGSGDTLWVKNIVNDDSEFPVRICSTKDGGCIVAGYKNSDLMLYKFDAFGNTFTNYISGTVFIDENSNCIFDSGEVPFPLAFIERNGGQDFCIANDQGKFFIDCESGEQHLTVITPGNLWGVACPATGFIDYNFASTYDTLLNADFGLEPNIDCQLLNVNIASSLIRPCFGTQYYVSYSNIGSVTASDAYVLIEFDPYIVPVSCALPWTQVSDNNYEFQLGDISIFESGNFTIFCEVSCDAEVGNTYCSQAHIFPDSVCITDSEWDHSSVMVEGTCVEDSVFLACFTITNTGDPGDGDMVTASEYRIYENNILVFTGTFQLTGGETVEICHPTNGLAIRLEADQNPGHPGNSHPQETVEDCGDLTGESLGQIIVVPEDDNDSFIDIFCGIATLSSDPNEKIVYPAGVSDMHLVESNLEMEYVIYFQNTGTDTAFNVVIYDTIPNTLDITSFVHGISSHPCTYNILGSNILKYTFTDILLPDSNINEPMSHGMVTFSINQHNNLLPGTLIENRAGIVFDYNDPVITNYAWNIVSDSLFIITENTLPVSKEQKVLVYPNPFVNETNVFFPNPGNNLHIVELYDVTGNRVFEKTTNYNKVIINRTNLSDGIYFLKLYDVKTGEVNSEKLIVK